jgi:hypothetical protein
VSTISADDKTTVGDSSSDNWRMHLIAEHAFTEDALCLCSRRFNDLQGLDQHLRSSGQHATCKRYRRRFYSNDAFKKHLQKSLKHKSRDQSI